MTLCEGKGADEAWLEEEAGAVPQEERSNAREAPKIVDRFIVVSKRDSIGIIDFLGARE